MYQYTFSSYDYYVQYHIFACTCVSAAGIIVVVVVCARTVHNNSEKLCRDVNMVYGASPGAAAVLLVLLLRFASKAMYVTPNLLPQGLCITELKSHVPGMFLLPLLPQTRKPLIR